MCLCAVTVLSWVSAAGGVCAQAGEVNQAPPPPEKVQLLDGDAPDAKTGEAGEMPDAAKTPGAPGAPHKHHAPRGARHVHDGLLLRLHVGPTLGSATLRSDPEMRAIGLGAALSLDLGYALDPFFTIHARYSLATMLAGKATLGGDRVQSGDPRVSAAMFGLGATYVLMPANLYATLVVGLGVSTLQVDTFRDTDTDMGWALNLDVGKEWWVDDNTALGAALRGWFSAMAAESGANLYVPMVGVLLSATYQ